MKNRKLGILGKKIGMTRLFNESGEVVPVTVVEAGPCPIIQVKTKEKDGYEAIQIGYGQKKESRTNKPDRGRFKKANVQPLRTLQEIRTEGLDISELDKQITVSIFSPGELVDVTGTSKGKGFAGVMKKHHFKGQSATHGSERHRVSGSVGASSYPSRVMKGLRMSGRMGGVRVTVQNLTVFNVDPNRNLLLIRGSIPGPNNGVVMIKKAIKS
ncbi:TPA: 50S ribosomal protein L3 [bacterium]|nr:50S ribosomal protein L3 [bacterium]